MASVIDAIIILTLLCGIVLGYKAGFFRSTISAIGTILAIVGAFYLKNLISPILYEYCPFFTFKGSFAGLSSLNIFIYEAIAFLLVFLILFGIVKFLIKVSTGLEKVLDFTVILGIPSKIFGGLFGFIEAYVIIFILLFVFAQFSFSAVILDKSRLTDPILNNTPGLSGLVGNTYKAFKEVYNMKSDYENIKNRELYNKNAIEVMLKYEIVEVKNVKKLVEKGKIQIKEIDEVLIKYD